MNMAAATMSIMTIALQPDITIAILEYEKRSLCRPMCVCYSYMAFLSRFDDAVLSALFVYDRVTIECLKLITIECFDSSPRRESRENCVKNHKLESAVSYGRMR